MIKRFMLKVRLGYHARKWHQMLDQYDCGANLAEYMNPRLARHRAIAESIIEELKA